MKKDNFFHVSLKIILKDSSGRFLLLKMKDDSSMSGYYDFPGGRIGENESEQPLPEIIKRELIEEVGPKVKYKLDPRPVSYSVHNYNSKKYSQIINIFCIFFEADYLGGEIHLSEEHKDYDWVKVSPEKLNKYFVRGPLEGAQNYFMIKNKK